MDIRVNEVNSVQPAEAPKAAAPVDDSFKFTLAAAVDDAELQEKLTNLLNDIKGIESENFEKIIIPLDFLFSSYSVKIFSIFKLEKVKYCLYFHF